MRKNFILFLLFFASGMQLMAQTRNISGRVTDNKGNGLANASIVVKGTTIGTTSSNDGSFNLVAPTSARTLIVSYIGMGDKEINLTNETSYSISMSASSKLDMQEVVVVAYGTQRKEATTGSVSVIGNDVIKDRPVTSVEKALQGSAPGITVHSVSGQPGASSTVRIRGIGSFSASNTPLYIIDGVPANMGPNTGGTSGTVGDFTQVAQTANILSSIDPDDIESVTVLKDASAAALYGSRAGNGVIVITTKRGKSGKTKFNFSASTGFSKDAVAMHEVMSTSEYFKYYWDYYYRTRIAAGDAASLAASKANASTISALQANPYNNTNPYDANGQLNSGVIQLYDTDWRSAIRNQGRTNDYSMNASGGNDRSTFYLSGGYFKQLGTILASDFERFSFKLNFENKATDYLKVGVNTTFAHTDQNTPAGSTGAANPIRFVEQTSNVYPLYRLDAAGTPIPDPTGGFEYNYSSPISKDYNPVGLAKKNIYNAKTIRALINGFVEISFFEGFKFKSQAGADAVDIRETLHYYPGHGDGASVKGRTQKYAPRDIQLSITNLLTYDKRFNDHELNLLFGQEAMHDKYENLISSATTFPFEGLYELSSAATPTGASSSTSEKKMMSFFSRANYNFSRKYYLTGSVRRDGSSVFGVKNRYGTFWSVGGAWILTKENFMKGTSAWLNELKLRGSYGTSGNDNIPRYERLGLYGTGSNYGGQPGTRYTQLENPELAWEGNTVKEIGLEFNILRRVKGEVSYFDRGADGILFNKPLSYLSGFSSITTNLAKMKNYGIEAQLEVSAVSTKKFNWDISFNITSYKNKIEKMTIDSLLSGSQRWKVGKDRYQWYIREWAGVDPADGAPMWYIDDVATGKKITTKNWNSATRYESGSALPKFFGGFTNKFEFSGFDASIFVFYSVGGKNYDSYKSQQMHGGTTRGGQLSIDAYKAWKKPGDVTDVPRFLDQNTDLGTGVSTRFLVDGSYARVKSLNLGYTLPGSITSRLKISNARLYVSGENLFTWAKHKGMDPEVELTGITGNDIPNIKTISVGITLGL